MIIAFRVVDFNVFLSNQQTYWQQEVCLESLQKIQMQRDQEDEKYGQSVHSTGRWLIGVAGISQWVSYPIIV